MMMSGSGGSGSPELYFDNSVAGRVYGYSNGWGVACHSSSAISDTNWHYFVLTKDTSHNWKLYIDAVDVTVTDGTPQSVNTAGATEFGRQVGGATGYFAGSLDEIAIYKSVLTLSQVQAHYTAGGGVLAGSGAVGPAYIGGGYYG